MKAIRILFAAAIAVALCSCSDRLKSGNETRPHLDEESADADFVQYEVGEVLGPWVEGSLDIHFINTGRGESSLLIMPDGTTLLVDMAGTLYTAADAIADGASLPTPSRPSDDYTTGEVIIKYLQQYLPNSYVDYALISHFDNDHMGGYSSSLATAGDGTFRKTSVCEVGATIPYHHYLDRGWPDYDYPAGQQTGGKYTNLKAFLTWSQSTYGTECEQFDAGALDQIHMLYDADSYSSNFYIQNLSNSGRYWTGSGQNSTLQFPETYDTTNDSGCLPDENCFSNAFWLKFGKFDYYTGGDHQYNGKSTYSYKDSEAPMVKVIGTMDVAKANHHGTSNTNSQDFLNAICPTVWITNPWRDVQPNGDTVARVKKANSSVEMYATNLGTESTASASDFIATQGHIVVRVAPTASYYYVYVVDDSNFDYKVLKVKQYTCK